MKKNIIIKNLKNIKTYTDKFRDYDSWLFKLKSINNLIIRHDIDYDIDMIENLWKVEIKHNITSINYFMVDRAYPMEKIKYLYDKYEPLGFKFGIHINVVDFTNTLEEAKNLYKKHISIWKKTNMILHSCTAHGYDSSVTVSKDYTNWAIEKYSDTNDDLPNSFHKIYNTSDCSDHIYDSGGKLIGCKMKKTTNYESSNFTVDCYVNSNMQTWCLFHPIHYNYDKGKCIFKGNINLTLDDKPKIKSLSEYKINDLEEFIQWYKQYVPSDIHAVFSIVKRPIVLKTINILNKSIKENFYKKIDLFDAGGGWGCIGTALLHHDNVKYTCNDINKELIDIGKKIFVSYFDYYPKYIVGNFYDINYELKDYNHNIFVHIDYENGSPETGWFNVDFKKIYNFARKFDEIIISICKETARHINKLNPYTMIDETDFEKLFCQDFSIVEKDNKSDHWKILYHFKKNILSL